MPFAKTEFGIQAFKDRTPLMSARQRAAFVLINGVRDTRSLFSLTSSLGVNAEDLTHLVVQGFIVRALIPQGLAGGLPEVVDSQFQSVEPAPRPAMTEAERYLLAKTLATQLTASLGLMGFRLNLAVEAAADCQGLRALLPKMQAALGPARCEELERILTL
jgi:hypothetical protein